MDLSSDNCDATFPTALLAAMFEVPRPAGLNTGSINLAKQLLDSFEKNIPIYTRDQPHTRWAIGLYHLFQFNIDAQDCLNKNAVPTPRPESIDNIQLLEDAKIYAASVEPIQLAPFVKIDNEPMKFYGAENCEDEITFLQPNGIRINENAGHISKYPINNASEVLTTLANKYNTELVSYDRLKLFTDVPNAILNPFELIMKMYLGVDEVPLPKFDNVPFIRKQVKNNVVKYIFKARLCRKMLNRKSVSFPIRVTRKMCVEYPFDKFLGLVTGDNPSIRPIKSDEAYNLFCTYLASGVRAGINNNGLQIEIEDPTDKIVDEMHKVAAYIRDQFYSYEFNIKHEDNCKY